MKPDKQSVEMLNPVRSSGTSPTTSIDLEQYLSSVKSMEYARASKEHAFPSLNMAALTTGDSKPLDLLERPMSEGGKELPSEPASDNRSRKTSETIKEIKSNGGKVFVDEEKQVLKLIDANGKVTEFDRRDGRFGMTDSRGRWTTEDGTNWFKNGNTPPKPADWQGRVEITDQYGVKETGKSGESWTSHLDGSRVIEKPNGSKITFDSKQDAIEVINPKGAKIRLKYDNHRIVEMTDSRGTYTTQNGIDWYKKTDANPAPYWKGSVSIDADGNVKETSLDSQRSFTWNTDGSKIVQNKDGSRITTDKDNVVTELINSKGERTTFEGAAVGPHGEYEPKASANGTLTMTDKRGTWITKTGQAWYKAESFSDRKDPWIGGVKVDPNTGTITETGTSNKDNKVTRRMLDGTVKVSEDPLPTSEFAPRALKVFDAIDRDGDGFLSATELVKAMEDPKNTGGDAQAIAAMYRNRQELQRLSNDEWGRELSLSKPDLEVFARQEKDIRLAKGAHEWAERNFEKFDTNNDQVLSKDEIAKALSKAYDREKESLQYLADNFNGDLSMERIARQLDQKNNESFGKLTNMVRWHMERTSDAQQAHVPTSLYGDKDNPLKSITPEAIRQGTIGNCFFEAAVASIAASGPQKIHNLIADNGNGTFTVTFPGDRKNPITVSAPTDAEKGLSNNSSQYGIWPNVLEKAYGEYLHQQDLSMSSVVLGGLGRRTSTAADGADGGGFAESAFALMTGTSADADMLNFTFDSTTKTKLTEAFRDGRAVSCSYLQGRLDGLFSADHSKDGFIRSHEFSITGWDPSGADGGTLTIRNPWGQGAGTRGTSRVSFKQFMDNFNHITYEGSH